MSKGSFSESKTDVHDLIMGMSWYVKLWVYKFFFKYTTYLQTPAPDIGNRNHRRGGKSWTAGNQDNPGLD